MMKFRSLSLVVLAASLLLACTTEDLLQEELLETPSGEYEASLFEKGHVRIYVDVPTAERIEKEGAETEIMKHIRTLNTRDYKKSMAKGGCGECQTSCQSACKTSCTVGNQSCENKKS